MSREPKIEARLEDRARTLGREPWLDPAKSKALREQLAREAASQDMGAGTSRWAWGVVLSVAALVIALLVLSGDPERSNYGQAQLEVALLESSGRVLTNLEGLRSGAGEGGDLPSSCLLELRSATETAVALRIRIGDSWENPWRAEVLDLEAESVALEDLPIPPTGLRILVIASQQPIPAEVIDEVLSEFGYEALEERLGCRTYLRELGVAKPADGESESRGD